MMQKAKLSARKPPLPWERSGSQARERAETFRSYPLPPLMRRPLPQSRERWDARKFNYLAKSIRILLTLCILLFPLPISSATPTARAADPLDTAGFGNVQGVDDQAIRRAVQAGARHLLSLQHADGSIHDRGHETAMTALSIMALASIGTVPSDPTPEAIAMRRAIDYVVNPKAPVRSPRQDAQGYFGRADGSRMYGHGITTLMLTEMVGMGADEQQDIHIRESLDAAINVILSAQNVKKSKENQGGWRYGPDSTDSDLSVSVWQLMALRSAKNDGMSISSEAIDSAVQYLVNSFTSPLDADGKPREPLSGFSYTPGQNRPTFAMTAAGLLAMQVCGQYESPLSLSAADWLLANPPKLDERFYYYGNYYYAQAMHQRGGRHAQEAAGIVSRMLLAEQNADGSWSSTRGEERNYGSSYATALAMLSLSVTYHYLPIYQR